MVRASIRMRGKKRVMLQDQWMRCNKMTLMLNFWCNDLPFSRVLSSLADVGGYDDINPQDVKALKMFQTSS